MTTLSWNTLTPGGTFYLRILKTTKGYLAQYSTNGAAWKNMLPRSAIPRQPTATFVNEKIRIFQAGGPADPAPTRATSRCSKASGL